MFPLLMNTLCDEVEVFTNEAAGQGLTQVRNGYARVLQGLIPYTDPPVMHSWSFMRPVAFLALPATMTGTGTGVYDGSTYTVITATANVFDAVNIGDTITVNAVDEYELLTFTGRTIMSIDGDNAFAAKSLSFDHPGIVDLPADFHGMVEPFDYVYESSERGPPIKKVEHEYLQELRRDSNTAGDPRYYSIVPKVQSQDAEQAWEVWVWPRPDAARIWTYRYLVQPTDVSDAAKYFLGAPLTNQVIRYAALADAEAKMGQKPGYWERLYKEAMVAAVQEDKRNSTQRVLSTAGK